MGDKAQLRHHHELLQARKTHLTDRHIATHKWDKMPAAGCRFFVYRYGEIDNHDIDQVFGKVRVVDATTYQRNKSKLARIQTNASFKARRKVLRAVITTVHSSGTFNYGTLHLGTLD